MECMKFASESCSMWYLTHKSLKISPVNEILSLDVTVDLWFLFASTLILFLVTFVTETRFVAHNGNVEFSIHCAQTLFKIFSLFPFQLFSHCLWWKFCKFILWCVLKNVCYIAYNKNSFFIYTPVRDNPDASPPWRNCITISKSAK